LVKSLGADEVIDYSREDFTKNGKKYDIIFDTVDKSSFARCKKSLHHMGFFLTVDWPFLLALWTSLFSNKKVIIGMAPDRVEDLIYLKELVESNIIIPVIDKTYSLEEAVEAYRYVDTGRKRGNVILKINSESNSLY
jgi:NADPH:quinone reductase-like Zn-dependent oxidoreductase